MGKVMAKKVYVFYTPFGVEYDRTSSRKQADRLTTMYKTLCGGGEWRTELVQPTPKPAADWAKEFAAWINGGCQEVIGL